MCSNRRQFLPQVIGANGFMYSAVSGFEPEDNESRLRDRARVRRAKYMKLGWVVGRHLPRQSIHTENGSLRSLPAGSTVFDTNIFIPSLLQPQGLPAEILTLAVVGERVRLCVSADIYSEYEEVIRRSRFRRSEQEVADALRAIRERGLWAKPSQRIRACSDPDDDVFLECPHAAKVHFLVTGKLKHLPDSWRDSKVVSARQFLDALAELQQ